MANILVIDDERSIRNTLKEILEYEKFTVDLAENGIEGLEKYKKGSYDIVLCDIKMPEMDGLEVLEKLFEEQGEAQVIMISGHGSVDNAVEAIKKGAYDFIEKPLDLNRLLITVRNALDKTTLISETRVLKKKVAKGYEMIGESEAIGKVQEIIEKVAPTDARVLITYGGGSVKKFGTLEKVLKAPTISSRLMSEGP